MTERDEPRAHSSRSSNTAPVEQRAASPQVFLSLYAKPSPKPDLADRSDNSHNDDSIIGHLAQFKEDNPEFDVRLLTRDSGPAQTANSLGIPYIVARDQWLLAPEPDARDKVIEELTREVQALRSREPEFDFSYDRQPDGRPGHLEIRYESFEPLDDAEQEHLLQRLRTQYPPTVIDRDRISQQSIDEYVHRDHPAWILPCEEWVQYVHGVVQLERCPEFTVRIVPEDFGRRITGEIRCTVHADNLANPAEFKLVVTLFPEKRPTLPPALSWFTTPHPDE